MNRVARAARLCRALLAKASRRRHGKRAVRGRTRSTATCAPPNPTFRSAWRKSATIRPRAAEKEGNDNVSPAQPPRPTTEPAQPPLEDPNHGDYARARYVSWPTMLYKRADATRETVWASSTSSPAPARSATEGHDALEALADQLRRMRAFDDLYILTSADERQRRRQQEDAPLRDPGADRAQGLRDRARPRASLDWRGRADATMAARPMATSGASTSRCISMR